MNFLFIFRSFDIFVEFFRYLGYKRRKHKTIKNYSTVVGDEVMRKLGGCINELKQ